MAAERIGHEHRPCCLCGGPVPYLLWPERRAELCDRCSEVAAGIPADPVAPTTDRVYR